MKGVIKKIIKELESKTEWIDKYNYIINLKSLMREEQKVDDNLVFGCLVSSWIVCHNYFDRYYFTGYSNSKIMNGVLYIICLYYSGHTKEEIDSMEPDFLNELGITGMLPVDFNDSILKVVSKIKSCSK